MERNSSHYVQFSTAPLTFSISINDVDKKHQYLKAKQIILNNELTRWKNSYIGIVSFRLAILIKLKTKSKRKFEKSIRFIYKLHFKHI